MPDWDRLQRYIEHLYSHGKIPSTFTTEGERPPEQVLSEVQDRTPLGYQIMEIYNRYIEEAERRGIEIDGW